MTINERIRVLRKDLLGMTLDVFGKKVGVTKAAVSDIERGRNNVTEQMFNSICREFGVSSTWLRDGTGEPLLKVPSTAVDALCQEFHLDAFDKAIIEEYLQMDERSRRIVKDYIRRIAKKVVCVDPSIDEEVAAYRDELLEEKNQEDGLSVSGTQLDA